MEHIETLVERLALAATADDLVDMVCIAVEAQHGSARDFQLQMMALLDA